MLKKSLITLLVVLGIGFVNAAAQTDKPISKGVVNGSAVSLPKPAYPAAARAVRAGGAVNVQVLIDEEGNVITANAVSGHPLLRLSSEQAARSAKFKPTLLQGVPVKVNGVIVYNFVPPPTDENEAASSETPPKSKGAFIAGRTVGSDDSSTIVNRSAISLVKPAYPAAARAVRADGAVRVKVVIDEEGNVESAEAVSGHPLLQSASVNAALLSKFRPTLLRGESVKVEGIVVYNFVADNDSRKTPDSISGGVLNGKALSLPKPAYPMEARAERAGGAVTVQVTIDEEGNVISANAASGHPLLHEASEQAARRAKFSPTLVEGNPVKVTGVIVYNFVP